MYVHIASSAATELWCAHYVHLMQSTCLTAAPPGGEKRRFQPMIEPVH